MTSKIIKSNRFNLKFWYIVILKIILKFCVKGNITNNCSISTTTTATSTTTTTLTTTTTIVTTTTPQITSYLTNKSLLFNYNYFDQIFNNSNYVEETTFYITYLASQLISNYVLFLKSYFLLKLIKKKLYFIKTDEQALIIQFLVNLTLNLPIVNNNITNINLISNTLFVLSKLFLNNQSAVNIIFIYILLFIHINIHINLK